MNKAQARAATAKLLAVNPHRSVMEAFMAGASVTLLGEHIPAPRWSADALAIYVAFKDGKEVARTETTLVKQDEVPGNVKPIAPIPKEETPETKAFKAEQERLEKLRKGVSTWDRFKDLGATTVDKCQAGETSEGNGWRWFIPGRGMHDPREYSPTHMRERRYDVIRRDGYLFKNIPESILKWGAAQLGNERAEIIRFRECNRAEVFANPPGNFMKATRRVFSLSLYDI